MKRFCLFCLIVVLLVSCVIGSTAEKDIVFRDIPWGSSLPEVEKVLDKAGFYVFHMDNVVLGKVASYYDFGAFELYSNDS